MHLRYFLLSASLIISFFFTVSAQSDYYFNELLEEKVRDENIRHYLKAAKLKFNAGESYTSEIEELNKISTQITEGVYAYGKTGEANSDNNFGFGAEPFIAVNSIDTNVVVISYMEQTTNGLEMPVYYSTDGSNTWTKSVFSTEQTLSDKLGTTALGGGDPVLVFDKNGTLHMTWLYAYLEGFSFKLSMFYAYSLDGGENFIVPSNLSDHIVYSGDAFAGDLIDRQWMATDLSGGAYSNNLYLSAIYTGSTLSGAGEIVMVKDISSPGFPSTATLVIPSTTVAQTQFGNVQVDESGIVHFSCMTFDPNTGNGTVYYAKSLDGGASFSVEPISLATTTLPNSDDIPKTVHSRENSAVSLAIDNENVFVAWSDMNGGVKSYYAYSPDTGNTWSTPVEFGEQLVGGDYYHLMPNVSANEQKMTISWYAVDTSTFEGEYLYVESLDNGVTFSSVLTISDGNTDFTGATTSEDFYGDYNTSVSVGCNTYTIWSDGNDGEPGVYVSKINNCTSTVGQKTIVNSAFQLVELYPNPSAAGIFNVLINNDKQETLNATVFDLSGKLLIEKEYSFSSANNSFVLDASNLSAGMYNLVLKNEVNQSISKLISIVK